MDLPGEGPRQPCRELVSRRVRVNYPASSPTARIGLRATSFITIFSLMAMLLSPLAAFAQSATPPGDTTGPVVTVPADITADANPETGTAVVSFVSSASDETDGAIAPVCDWVSDSAFPVGATLVTCTATDAAGNIGTGSFTVSVNAAPQPTATSTTAPEPTNTVAPEPTAVDTVAPEATSTTA